ncbi:heavy metal translocating P-type ATPase [Micrococcus lylae]|uniref:heavy metal translocating P-type ATPase n=1 Tax=Micrococcus lylae TaxID=1273 RepID=UPI000C8100F3|nr:heavy metal translocating P-type ATPase [Micrococcus lylae]WIK81603.1 heavy metal translocating P-type ATPase [Micrococcus lylae]
MPTGPSPLADDGRPTSAGTSATASPQASHGTAPAPRDPADAHAQETPAPTRTVTLDVTGMTCASCVRRVERKLGKVDGVSATVNLPLEQAAVTAPESVSDAELIAAVEAAGYGASVQEKAPAVVGKHGNRRPDDGTDPAAPDGGTPAGSPADPASGATDAHAPDTLLRRLVVAALLTVPTVVVSMVPAAQFTHWGWVALVLSAPVVFYAAWPFHAAAARTARHGSSTMDTLVSVGVLVSWGYSTIELLLHPQMTAHVGRTMAEMADHSLYFETAAVITTFLLLGRWLEARAKRRAGQALRTLLDLGAAQATLWDPATRTEQVVPAESLAPGDTMLIRPGEKVPTDAVVVEGTSAVDASLLTGESVPVEVGPGDELTGATVNVTGRLVARAVRTGADTTLAQMGRLVAEAQTGKAKVARLADRISAVFVPIVMAIAAVTLVVWLLVTGGDVASALRASVAVLVIACPCALGLATPVGLLAGTGRASQLGILIRGPEVLEDSRTVDTIVLDKTGTVTEGRMRLTQVVPLPDGRDDGDAHGAFVRDNVESPSAFVRENVGSVPAAPLPDDGTRPRHDAHRALTPAQAALLTLAAAVEHGSEHPIAKAIVEGAAEHGLQLPAVEDFASSAGGGVSGRVVFDDQAPAESAPDVAGQQTAGQGTAAPASQHVAVGRGDLILQHVTRPFSPEAEARFSAAEESGSTAVWVAVDGELAGFVAVQDTVKESSAAAIADLKAMGLRPMLVTGDNAAVAQAVAAEVGIDPEDVVAGVRPEAKVEVVRSLQGEGAVVGMVGDGVNDAPALALADVGIAMGSGTDVAREAAAITVMGSDLRQVVQSLELSRKTLGVIRMNLFWAFAYNTLGIPVAALGLLNPMIAGGAMAASSVLVVLNSLRLTRYAR